MIYEVYSYWNFEELRGTFNAVAALTNSADFTGLLRLLAMIAIVAIVLAVLAGRARHEDFWRWVIMLAVVNGMLLVPKSTVLIVDRVTGKAPVSVANVPIGLAAIAHGTSKIGDWMTRAYETTFALPNDLQMGTNGFLFGHRLLSEAKDITAMQVSAAWLRDYQEFWRECVMPDISSGYLPLDTLRNAQDIWIVLSNTNPALYVTLSTSPIPMTCPQAYNDLGTRLNNQVVQALIQRLAQTKYPGDAAGVTKIKNAIASTYAYGLNLPWTAEAVVKQAMLVNNTISSYCNVFAQLGNASEASICYAATSGAYQTNFTYQVLAKIAESSMPKLKSAIEIVQYAVFPFVLAFAIVAAHLSLPVLKTYIMSLVWIQLWTPLYAIVHYIQTVKMTDYGSMLGSLAGSLSASPDLYNITVSDQAVAGMLVVAIPPIAAALVKGGEVGLQAVAGLVSAPKTAERQAADTAKGNENVGQWNTQPNIRWGHLKQTYVDERGIETTFLPDGNIRVDASGIAHRGNLNIRMGSKMSSLLTQSAEEAERAARSTGMSYAEKTIAALGTTAEFIRAHEKFARKGGSWSDTDLAKVASGYSTATQSLSAFQKLTGLSESQSAKVMSEIGGGIDLPIVTAKLRQMGSSEAARKIEENSSKAISLAQNYTSGMEKIGEVAHKQEYSTGDSTTARGMRAIRGSLDEAREFAKQEQAMYEKASAYRNAASKSNEKGGSWDVSLNRQFVDWMTKNEIDPYTGRNFTSAEVYYRAEHDPMSLEDYKERFLNTYVKPRLDEFVGKISPESVRRQSEQNFTNLSQTQQKVTNFGNESMDAVRTEANRNNVNPDTWIHPGEFTKDIENKLKEIGNQVQKNGGEIIGAYKAKGEAFVAAWNKDGSLLLKAASNASTVVLPEGTVNLLSKAGMTPGQFAEQVAKNYKGDTQQAIIDTVLFAASVAGGGVAGKIAGGVIGRIVGSKAAQAAMDAALAKGASQAAAKQIGQEVGEKIASAITTKGINAGALSGVAIGKGLADSGIADAAVEAGRQVAMNLINNNASQPAQPTAPTQPAAQPGSSGQPPVDGLSWRQVNQTNAGLLGGSPGGSNWGRLLGGGRRPTQGQSQQTEGNSGKKDDTPPPGKR